MKKLIILPALFFSFSCAAQKEQKVKESEVPAAVKSAVTAKYPGAEVEHWTLEDGNYEAEFDVNELEMSMLVKTDGSVLETETEIKVSELPQSVQDYCAKNFAGKKIKEASKIEAADGTMTYEAEIDGKDQIFDANGNFLKTE